MTMTLLLHPMPWMWTMTLLLHPMPWMWTMMLPMVTMASGSAWLPDELG